MWLKCQCIKRRRQGRLRTRWRMTTNTEGMIILLICWLASTGCQCLCEFLSKIVVLTCRAINGSASSYLSSYFTHVTDVPSWQRRSSASFNRLTVPSFCLTTVVKRVHAVFDVNLWNDLSSRHHICTVTLCLQLKTFMFCRSYLNLLIWYMTFIFFIFDTFHIPQLCF